MSIYDNGLAERRVNRIEFGIARFRRGCAPGTLGTAVHKRHRTMNLHARQGAQPGEPLFSQRGAGRHGHLFDRGKKRLQLGRLFRKLLQRRGPEEHFIRIANHALPAKIANLIHNSQGTGSAVSQIAAVEDQVGRGLPQIRQDCLKRGSVAVDVGYDGDAQRSSTVPGNGTIPRYHGLVSDNLYDQVHYETFPRRQTHPDRLAAIASLFGMDPAPIPNCRVLEIGCGDGGNLIPMAYYLPGGRFTGIDLAAEPIAAGCAAVRALGLRNLTLKPADLRDIDPEYGEFDYIIAHGLYSWVPADVRDRLMAVCRQRLAPQGVAFISYNVLPGRYIPQMLREMMRFHTRQTADAPSRIGQARGFLQFLRDGRRLSPKLQALVEEEIENLLKHRDGSLFHDDLAEINDPVYFHEFAAHAARHGLQYLGEVEPHEMFDPIDSLQSLHPPAADIVEREQYLDFLKARRFRRTLLCHEGIPLRREVDPAALDTFLFSSMPFSIADGAITNQHGSRITIVDPAVERVVRALSDAHPLPVEFEELIPYAGARESLRHILFGLTLGAIVNLHVYDFPCEETLTERPVASRLVRHEATHGPQVTNACHTPVKLDEVARHLVCLLDGTRDQEAISQDLASIEGAPPLEDIRRGLPGSLQWLAKMALLEG